MTIDGRFLAFCRDRNKIILQEIENNENFWTSDKSSATIELIALSPNGKWLASYNQDQKIEIWRAF
jgi:WD40 repeat protein